jgi:Uma2 family endonuclease
MALHATTRMTYEDYVKLPDDGQRYEIVDGELIVNAAPVPRHQRIVRVLLVQLDRYFEDHGGGEVFASPIDVLLERDSVAQPDLIVIKSERAAIIGEKNVQGAPDLVIEVLSDATRRLDEIDKRKLYERTGVDEYWIVDPVIEVVKIYRRAGDAAVFTRVAEIGVEDGGTITTPLLAGFVLDVNDVFGVAS